MKGILGKKIGMTQFFTAKGILLPVTALYVPPNVVVQVKKRQARDGYDACQLGAFPVTKGNRAQRGHYAKSNLQPHRFLREIRNMTGYQSGTKIEVATLFQVGDPIDVQAVSKGKGFAGVIKRYNFHRGPMAHGSSYHRGIGSLGVITPKRIYKQHKMPGHMGHVKTTIYNQQIVKIDPDHHLVYVCGSVPGPRQGLVVIKSTVKVKTVSPPPVLFTPHHQAPEPTPDH